MFLPTVSMDFLFKFAKQHEQNIIKATHEEIFDFYHYSPFPIFLFHK